MTHVLSHLPPTTLSAVSLVSHRFHDLVTTPHAWRIAFSRCFPGPEVLSALESAASTTSEEQENIASERRVFARLTALASWRSEYILRTRLLRSLGRGKPAQFQGIGASGSSRSGPGHSGNAQITYNSNLFSTVNHLDAFFGTGLNKRLPCFMHGADETGSASSSDPNNGKVDAWGFLDPHSSLQFSERFPGEAEYGLGPGEVVGVPNSMGVSQQHGVVVADGSPGGLVYYRSTEEQRGRLLASSRSQSAPELGIPRLEASRESMCCVWIAKKTNVPLMTEGLIGIMSGSSYGVLTAYSLGTNSLRGRRFDRGEVTARWILSPGVPIIAISVDEHFTSHRQEKHRIWAVVLNALGEVFYLSDLPIQRSVEPVGKLNDQKLDELAWETGQTICWRMIESTRRLAKTDPFDRSDVDGSYTPRSSWNGTGLSRQQIAAETKEIEAFLKHRPKHFREVCFGWDMRRRLEVDFAADDGNGAGEAIIVCGCGLDEGTTASIRRFTRCKIDQFSDVLHSSHGYESPTPSKTEAQASLFGDSVMGSGRQTWSFDDLPPERSSSMHDADGNLSMHMVEEWRMSVFVLGGLKSAQITTTAIDMSTFSHLTISEDPLLSMSDSSSASSPLSSPLGHMPRPGSPSDVPGQRARFITAGTKFGTVLVWNMRASVSDTAEIFNNVQPVRIIHTDSPQISCLALSALYLVHGGNDGLVQAWDPLASNTQPIRTLNSRFSSRARRRLVQAEASPQGVGINLFAAGAICLDSDATVLRGMVSLGTHLRYWSYSSSAADQYKSSKRRLRRSERGSNQGAEKFSVTGRGALKDYIANERRELERDKESRRKEEQRLAARYGVDLLGPGASEDEIMAYATLLSEEAAKNDEARKKSESEGSDEVRSMDTVTDRHSSPVVRAEFDSGVIDADVAEAIRLSLEEENGLMPSGSSNPFPVKYVKTRSSPSQSPRAQVSGGSGSQAEVDDLDFALQLSLTEEKSRREMEEEFPALSKSPSPTWSSQGKGKRRKS